MLRTLLYAKLHKAKITQVDLEYEGSMEIDEELLSAAGILINEQIHVYNLDNGARFTTYAIPAPAGSRKISANGACAHLVKPGQRVIICVYGIFEVTAIKDFIPKILFLDEKNDYICANSK